MLRKTTKNSPYRILVTGDVVFDHHIYRGQCQFPTVEGCGTRIIRSRGGAGQTARLLDELYRKEPLLHVDDPTPKLPKEESMDPRVHHAYATWTPFPPTKSDKKDSHGVWRVNETFGFGPVVTPPEKHSSKDSSSNNSKIDVIVIDEGGLGFRLYRDQWPSILTKKGNRKLPWIVMKMSHPVCCGELWNHLMQDTYRNHLIVIVSADDLRLSRASISKGLSWEKSVRELLGDLRFHPEISTLTGARHLIVNFGHDGALWIDSSNRKAVQRWLVFDPGHLEGIWEENLDGSVLGAGSCLPASVAHSMFEVQEDSTAKETEKIPKPGILTMTDCPDLGAAIARGLMARRALLKSGHGTTGAERPDFPFVSVIGAITGVPGGDMSTVQVPEIAIPNKSGASFDEGPYWSIISGNPAGGYRPLYGRARMVAFDGETALTGIPYGRFNKLYTVDHIELTSYFGIRKLINDYKNEKRPKKPLSIGVFGPPGSGKSFGIKQIVRGILNEDVPILTFNLSQFTGPEMLTGALHQVRDEVLRGKIPVVFWDEFDSEKLKWLQFLLAPMNDGEFLEGQVTHPIGKCIFVFAGGTVPSLDAFEDYTDPKDPEAFKNLKGPDFVSRLNCYLNVLGPNPRMIKGKPDPTDVGFPVRRAIMLRVHAGKFKSESLSIDRGLLNAMLKIDEFKHGARSMETIIKLTTGGGQRPLLRCNLPPREQLGLHVDFDKFMVLVQEDALFQQQAEKLAPFIHDNFRELVTKQEAEKPKEDQRVVKPYPELTQEEKQDNIAAARRLTDVLSLAGLEVVDNTRRPGADAKLVEKIIEENLETLAEAEHIGWCKVKESNGWTFGKPHDPVNKVHPSLDVYRNLNQIDKEKDRNSVRKYPSIVKEARFKILIEGK